MMYDIGAHLCYMCISEVTTQYVLVSDYFTRLMEAYSIPNQEALTVATKMVDEFSAVFQYL